MKIFVKVQLQQEGIHAWFECPLNEVNYLRHLHRHIFHISCTKKVSHKDRDIEIISLKHSIQNYLVGEYGNPCDFGSRSCEMIAHELLNRFQLDSCEVLEDGENGAIITK